MTSAPPFVTSPALAFQTEEEDPIVVRRRLEIQQQQQQPTGGDSGTMVPLPMVRRPTLGAVPPAPARAETLVRIPLPSEPGTQMVNVPTPYASLENPFGGTTLQPFVTREFNQDFTTRQLQQLEQMRRPLGPPLADLDDDISDLEARLQTLYISQRAAVANPTSTAATKRSIQADIIKLGTEIDALRRQRKQRSGAATPTAVSRPTTPQRRRDAEAEREAALLRERRRALQGQVTPITAVGQEQQSLTVANRELLRKALYVFSFYRREIEDKLLADKYDDEDEEDGARQALLYLQKTVDNYKTMLGISIPFLNYQTLLKEDEEFRKFFAALLDTIETRLENDVRTGVIESKNAAEGWRNEVVDRFEEDVYEFTGRTYELGLAGAFRGIANWLSSFVTTATPAAVATTPEKAKQVVAARGLEEVAQTANAIASSSADIVQRQARRAAVDAREASRDAVEDAIVARRAQEIRAFQARAEEIDLLDDAAHQQLGAATARGSPADIARARRAVAQTSAADEQNRAVLDLLNDRQETAADRQRRRQAEDAAKERRNAAELARAADQLAELPRQVAGVVQNAQNTLNSIEAATTFLKITLANDAVPFFAVSNRDPNKLMKFPEFFQKTFGGAKNDNERYQIAIAKNDTSTFTINRIGAAAAHSLIALLFGDILQVWANDEIQTGEALRTKIWTETLIPFLAIIIREATAMKNDRTQRNNEFARQFWDELRASVSWLFCLALTGVTAPPDNAADAQRSQQFQGEHALAISAFEVMDGTAPQSRYRKTQNQLLSKDRDALGFPPAGGVLSPILKMLETMPAFDSEASMRVYVSNIFCLPLFEALYKRQLSEKFSLPRYVLPSNIVPSDWRRQYDIIGKFFGPELFAADDDPATTGFNFDLLQPAESADKESKIDQLRKSSLELIRAGKRIVSPPEAYTIEEFNDFEEDLILAIVAWQLASFAFTMFKVGGATMSQKILVTNSVVGVVMFAPFRIDEADAQDNKSLWARFGKRPVRKETNAKGSTETKYLATAGKAGGIAKTQRSQFRPSWFPVRFGGQSTKLLGELIAKSSLIEARAFRREIEKDERLAALLNDEDNGYEITVLVPSTEALSNRAVQSLLLDANDSIDLFEYHVLDQLLDFPELSKRSQKMHTVLTEYEQLPVKFSVNAGFSAEHGGSLTLGENTSVFGDGKTVQVIAGPFRAKNGVFYVINSVLDHKKALRALGRIERVPPRLQPGQLPPPIARDLPLEEQYDFPLAPNGPFAISTTAKADYIAGRIAIAPDRRQESTLSLAKKKHAGSDNKKLFAGEHERKKQELMMKNFGRTKGRHSMKSRTRHAARSSGDDTAKSHDRSLMAMRMLLEVTGVNKKIYAIEQAGRRPIVILAPTQEVLDGVDFSALSYDEQVAIVQQHVLFVNWRGEEATDDDLLTPTALESLFKNDVSKTSFETFNGRRAPNVELLPDARTNEEATPGANVLRSCDFKMPLETIVYQDGIPGKPRFPTYIYFVCKLLVPTTYGDEKKTITSAIKFSTLAPPETSADRLHLAFTDATLIVRDATSVQAAVNAIDALQAKIDKERLDLSRISKADWQRFIKELHDARWANRALVGDNLQQVKAAIDGLRLPSNYGFSRGARTTMQTNARQFISVFVDYQKDAVRTIQRAQRVEEALDAVRQLTDKIYEQDHYLVSITRSNWDLLIDELREAVDGNGMLSGNDKLRVHDEIALLSTHYNQQPRDDPRIIDVRVPLFDVDAFAARERSLQSASKPQPQQQQQQQQQQKTTSAHASPAKPPVYELPRDAKVHAQEWLTEFNRSTNIMARTNDVDKFSAQIESLNSRLDRIGGAKTIENEIDRTGLIRIFENMEQAIARNRDIDVSYKEDARESLYNLQKRFGL